MSESDIFYADDDRSATESCSSQEMSRQGRRYPWMAKAELTNGLPPRGGRSGCRRAGLAATGIRSVGASGKENRFDPGGRDNLYRRRSSRRREHTDALPYFFRSAAARDVSARPVDFLDLGFGDAVDTDAPVAGLTRGAGPAAGRDALRGVPEDSWPRDSRGRGRAPRRRISRGRRPSRRTDTTRASSRRRR